VIRDILSKIGSSLLTTTTTKLLKSDLIEHTNPHEESLRTLLES